MNSLTGVGKFLARPSRTTAPLCASSSDGRPAIRSRCIEAVPSDGNDSANFIVSATDLLPTGMPQARAKPILWGFSILDANREHQLPCGPPALQIVLGFANIFQGVSGINQQLQLPSPIHREYCVGNGSKLVACSDIIKRDGTSNVQRAHCRESCEVKRRYRTARSSVKSEETTRPKAFQRLLKGHLAYSVVDDVESSSFCDLLHFFVKFRLSVVNDYIRAGLACKLCLPRTRGRRDDRGTRSFGHLGQRKPTPPAAA